MNTENEIYQKLKEFILKVSRRKTIGDDDDIFEGGIVNSLFAMQLVIFLEKQFDIHIDGKDLKANNFKNIRSIVSYIENKQKALRI